MPHASERWIPSPRSDRAARRTRRRREVALEGLEARVVPTQLAYGLFDTGVNSGGAAATPGTPDSNYTLIQTQEGTGGMPAEVASGLAYGWGANTATTRWISPSPDQFISTSPPGTYVYQTTFQVPAGGVGTGTLSGSLAEDDTLVDIAINNKSTGYSQSDNFSPVAFSVPATLVAGTNTIDFTVQNNGTGPNPTGLFAQNLGLTFAPNLTVAQPTITVGSGGNVTNTGTFGDLDPTDPVTLTSSQGTITTGPAPTGGGGTFTFTESNVTTSGPVTITATDAHGNTQTATFTITAVAPTLTGGGTTASARTGSSAVVVDPDLVVTDPDGGDLATASVSINTNFTAGEDLLAFTPQDGITGSYNAAQGTLTLTGSATPAQYQAALRSVTYQDTNTDPVTADRAPRSISFSIAPGAYDPANGHFYVFVADPGVTWTAAEALADASSLYGQQGYLATLTSAAEDTFAFSKTNTSGWIGASDANNLTSPTQVVNWRWVDGPEAGLQFFTGLATDGGMTIPGQFSNWDVSQPDNYEGKEFYAQLRPDGLWNDLANDALVNGYLVEYGGTAGDPTLQLTASTTVDLSSITDAPVVATPAAPLLTNSTTGTTITGTADAGSLVQVYDDANNSGIFNPGDPLVGSEQLAAGQTNFSITSTLVANTVNHLIVTATYDPATNPALRSGATPVPAITSDTIAPVAPTVTRPASAITINATSYVVQGTAEAGSLVTLYADPNHTGSLTGLTAVGTVQLAAGETTFQLPTVALAANSANDFLVTATDAAGNVSAPAVVPTITTDSIAPVAPIVTDPAAAITINATSYTVRGTAEAGSLVTLSTGAGASAVVVGTEQLAAGATTFAIPVALAANAANNFAVTATDAAGNVSLPATVPTITTDSIAPAAPVIANPSNSVAAGTTSLVLTGTAEAGTLVTIYADTNGNGALDPGEAAVGTEQLAAGQTGFSITVPLTAGATNFFLATATDAAGNVSPTAAAQAAFLANLNPPPSATFAGRVFLNLTAAAFDDPSAPGLPQRALYLDLNNSGVYQAGDPTTTTDGSGNFSFGTVAYTTTLPTVRELVAQDVSYRYVLDQSSASSDGTTNIGATPYSPVYPVTTVAYPASATPGTDANTNYVRSLYEVLLGRTGSDAEIAAWTATMTAGATDAQVAAQINNSPEHRQDQVAFFYQAYLHRAVDPGSSYWVNQLLNGASEQSVSEGILDSAEFQGAQADQATLVRDLYLDVLGRVGGDSEVNAYLGANASATDMVDMFVNSMEGDEQIVQSLYSVALNRARETPGSDGWVDELNSQGASASTVAVGILTSPEFVAKATPTASIAAPTPIP